MNAPRAIAALLDDHKIRRPGWRNKFHLATRTFEGLANAEPVIVRVNADGSEWPWTPTEDDLFAADWVTNADDDPFRFGSPDRDGDSFAWALAEICDGREVLIGAGPLRLVRGETHGGPCIDIVLPNGVRRLWRPQHQDLWGMYTAAGL